MSNSAKSKFPGRKMAKSGHTKTRRSSRRQTLVAEEENSGLKAAKNIEQGFKMFNKAFGDSEDEEAEFYGYTDEELRACQEKADSWKRALDDSSLASKSKKGGGDISCPPKKVLIRPSKLGHISNTYEENSDTSSSPFSRGFGKRAIKPSFKLKEASDHFKNPVKLTTSAEEKVASSEMNSNLASQWSPSRLRKVENKFVKSSSRISPSPNATKKDDEERKPSSAKPLLRESKLVLNQKLLERLRKPSQQVEFYQAIQRSMQSADKVPPKLVQGPDFINPAGTALVEESAASGLLNNDQTQASTSKKSALSSATNNRMPGNIVCGICGAVRYYAFILQAKKFGTFSCEPCRKFISKTIKMSQQSKATDEDEELFPCVSGTGLCVVPPVLRSVSGVKSKKSERKTCDLAQSGRCQACWLKLCLIGYKLEASLYDKLRSRLPIVFHDLLPEAAEREKAAFDLLPNRGEILEFNRQVPLSRPLFDGFGVDTEEKAAPVISESSGKRANEVTERLPNGWSKKAVKRLTGSLKGKWDMFLITPDRKTIRSAKELKIYVAKSGAVIDANIVNFSLPKKVVKADKLLQMQEDDEKKAATSSTPQKASTEKESFVKKTPVTPKNADIPRSAPKSADSGSATTPKSTPKSTPNSGIMIILPKSSRREVKVPAKFREPEQKSAAVLVLKKSPEKRPPTPPTPEKESSPEVSVDEVKDDFDIKAAIEQESAMVAKKSVPPSRQKTPSLGVGTFSIDADTAKGLASGKFVKRIKIKRCGKCTGCKTRNCRDCIPCKDMLKYGGQGQLKQACVLRKCSNPGTKEYANKREAEVRNHKVIKVRFTPKSEATPNVERIPVPPRSQERPNMSYSSLIAMAIQNMPEKQGTLNEIYEWINDAFPYFSRIDKAGWQNSIRHNLSLNKAFYRTKTDNPARKGGGIWRIDPKVSIGAFKKVKKSVNRPKIVKPDESFWEPDNDSYKDSSLSVSISQPMTTPVVTPRKEIPENPDEREQRRQSIEEFIEMGLANPGSSPVKVFLQDVDLEQIPIPPVHVGKKIAIKVGNIDQLKSSSLKVAKKSAPFSGSVDFYEPYDPDQVEVAGQAVVTTEPLPVDALCFLCGSAGEEDLLYCKACCEPYHPFCLNPEELPQTSEAEADWICRKCIQCQICGLNEGERMRCAKCTLGFHSGCLLPSQQKMIEQQASQQSWLCGQCLRCSSCDVANVLHFDEEDNRPLCDQCCLQRKKGSYCPLCEACYDDNDYETRMMECANCGGWIHAKCEGVDAEKYQVLSYLPNTIEYVCKKCNTSSQEDIPVWKRAVLEMMKKGFLSIVDTLTKDPSSMPYIEPSPITTKRGEDLEHAKRKLDFGSNAKPTCSVVVNDIRKHPWWGPKVRQLSGETENTVIKPKILKREPPPPQQPLVNFSKFLERIESDAFSGVLECHFELKRLINSVPQVTEEQKRAFFQAYEGIAREIFPWFDPNQPWSYFETDENIFLPPLGDDHQYVSTNEKKSPKEPKEESELASKRTRLDTRICQFCGLFGDRSPEAAGRLIHFRYSDWVHVNCALWSSEVYEEIDGSLQNVGQALNRGSKLTCTICNRKGATIGCCHEYCKENVHFECGRFNSAGSSFKEDKTVYCKSHKHYYVPIPEQQNFKSARTIHVEVESDMKKKSSKCVDLRQVKVYIGSLAVESLSDWQLSTQIADSSEEALIPIGFRCSRWFWSTLDPTRKVRYTCTVKTAKKPDNRSQTGAEVTIDHSQVGFQEAENQLRLAKLAIRRIEVREAQKTNILPPYAVSSIWTTLKYGDLHRTDDAYESPSKRPRYNLIRQASMDNSDRLSTILSSTGSSPARPLNKAVSNVLLKRTPSKILEDGSDLLAAFSRDFPGSDLIDSILREESKKDPSVDVIQTWFNQKKKVKVTEVAIQVNLPFTRTNFEMDELYEKRHEEENYESDESYEDFVEDYDMNNAGNEESADILSLVVEQLSKQAEETDNMDILKQLLDLPNEPNEEAENNNDFVCLSNEASPDKLLLPDLTSIPQFDGAGDENVEVKQEASPRKDFSIAGLLSPPPNPSQVQGVVSVQSPMVTQPQLVHGAANAPLRRPSDDDVVYIATSAPQPIVHQPQVNFGFPQLQPRMAQPPVYLHHLPNPAMAPNFAQSFQQQTGRTLHYVTSIPYQPFQYQNIYQPQPQISYLTPQGIIINQAPQPLFTPGASFQQPQSYFGSPSQFVSSTANLMSAAPGSSSMMPRSLSSESPQFQPPRKVARVQPQPQNIRPSKKVDPIKAMQSMASQPMNAAQDATLSISHNIPESNIDVTYVDDSPSTSKSDKQRSVGTQAKIGAPLKIISPRPWKGSTSYTPTTPTTSAEPIFHTLSSGVSVTSSRPNSHGSPCVKAIEEDHSYYCSSPDVNDDALVYDDKVVDKIRVKTKQSTKNAIKFVLQKNLHNDEYKIQEMTIEDGGKNPEAFPPKEAIAALKAKTKRKYKPRVNKEPALVVPLDGNGQVQQSQEQFVNEVLPEDQLPKLEVKKEEADDETDDSDDEQVIYELTSEDGGFRAASSDINKLWLQVFEAVQEARSLHGLKTIPSRNPIGEIGLQMLGLTHAAVSYLIEQLPGASEASNYSFKHHHVKSEPEDKLANNPSGCSRGEAFKNRKPLDMFSWLASRHRQRPDFYNSGQNPDTEVQIAAARRATSLDLPMAMRFRHLAKNAKEAVGVYSSGIHGRGLFCKREIQSGEMVIEYAGEEIRAMLTDKREKYYESRGIGCYMFKIDDDTVVDATMKGNAARFINHSCDPNCYSKIVDIFGKKHIIIFAMRKILPGEELTYDYKFPIEDVKIPCSCSARKCRKYMN